MGRAARGWRGAKERETPSVLGDDGPVGPLEFLLVLSHVAHTLGRSLVSQCYTTNRAHKVPVRILLAHSRRHSLTGTTADRSRRAWREERVSPQTCKWPKQVRLHCLLGLGEVKELRKDRVQGCRVISQRGQCAKDRTRRSRVINQCGDMGRGGEECKTRSFKFPSSFTPQRSPALPIAQHKLHDSAGLAHACAMPQTGRTQRRMSTTDLAAIWGLEGNELRHALVRGWARGWAIHFLPLLYTKCRVTSLNLGLKRVGRVKFRH